MFHPVAHLQAQGIAPAPPTDDENSQERSSSPLTSLSCKDRINNAAPDDTGFLKPPQASIDVKEEPQEDRVDDVVSDRPCFGSACVQDPGEEQQEQPCETSEDDVKEEPLEDEVKKALQDEIRVHEERIQQLKQRLEPKNSSARRIKSEALSVNVMHVVRGEVIDLTDDCD
ncbi:hypothetical protein BD410DRAFT_902370 [Rickenella mellea]|uniref:Uncharacterized protein n=1 Tax=Rickenella mellea TaxID=50990 RepID=A0A4Y7PLC4_9AGAM|nr:hypothetical protein BD410DRAFT_902370 [Rickenella mellea]